MNKNDFRTYLIAASYLTVKFGQGYVKQKLPSDFRFDIELNQSCEAPSDDGSSVYPEDNGLIHRDKALDDVVDVLSRNSMLPVWIDICVKSCTKDFTTLLLRCSGRYVGEQSELFYYDRGLGPFGIKGPDLPAGWVKGKKIKLSR